MSNEGARAFKDAAVIRDDGIRGKVVDEVSADDAERVVLQFDDGSRLAVSPDVLKPERDGTFRVSLGADAVTDSTDELVIPIVAEELEVTKDRVARGTLRVRKRVETHEETVDAPTVREEAIVEHVPVNALVRGEVPQVREEDGVLLIPVLEEILVVEKGLLHRETVRVSKRRTTTMERQTVALRRNVVDVERVEPDPPTASD